MKAKKMGIWMDHDHARLTEFTTDPMTTRTVHNEFSSHSRHQSLGKGESNMHVKENHELSTYYKTLGESIHEYQEVLLFGPTQAKHELLNALKKDRHFENIKIEVADTDKMSDNQIHAYVKKHFSKE